MRAWTVTLAAPSWGICMLVLGVLVVAATVAMVPATSAWATTYAGASVSAALADLLAGGALVAAGGLLAVAGRRQVAGTFAIAAAICWLAADWIGWQDGSPAIRTIGMLLAPLFPAAMLAVVVAVDQADAGSRGLRAIAIAAATGLALLSLLAVLFRDPAHDAQCWANCVDDVLLVANAPVLAGLVTFGLPSATIAVGAILSAVGIRRVTRATRAARTSALAIGLPAGALGMLLAVRSILATTGRIEGPQDPAFAVLFQLTAWSTIGVAAGLAWTVVEQRRRSAAVTHLARELAHGPRPGAVAATLAAAMEDPDLRVVYQASHGTWVDAHGNRVAEPVADEQHVITRLVNEGRVVALVSSARRLADPDRLSAAMGPAARLALENERLFAVLQARVAEAEASRVRIVVAADAERKRLERDLHDGAQQGFLAVLHALRRARGAAPNEILDGRTARLVAETEMLIGELRDVAHGIFPATLREAGLRGSLRTLADVAPIPVELAGVPDRRFSQPVEQAAYGIVAEAVSVAGRDGASFLGVRFEDGGDLLAIELENVPVPARAGIADRAAVAGGDAAVEDGRLLVRLPCASS